MARTIRVPYKPHIYQDAIYKALRRFSVFVCHRRFGKTVAMVNLLIRWALQNKKRNWRSAYIAPLYRQAEEIAWDYLKYYSSVVPGIHYDNPKLRCSFPNGSRITLMGADNPDSLRGPYWDAVVFDEYAQIRPKAWPEIIRPALVDRKGWAIFIGTPQGHNHFYNLWRDAKDGFEDSAGQRKISENWTSVMYKVTDTDVLDPEELERARHEMTPEQFEQEFMCSFEAALVGSYYGQLMQDAQLAGRITTVPMDPILLVHTAWDLGVDDQNAIWFFQVSPGGEIRLVDYNEQNNVGLDYYIKTIREKKYIYGQHFAPHDIQVREYSTGRSRLEFAESLGLKFEVMPQMAIADGIQAVRSILPRCWFDETSCDPGIQALKAYRKEYSDRLSTYKANPLHDWSSHGADAFRTLAMGLAYIQSTIPVINPKLPRYHERQHGWMM